MKKLDQLDDKLRTDILTLKIFIINNKTKNVLLTQFIVSGHFRPLFKNCPLGAPDETPAFGLLTLLH